MQNRNIIILGVLFVGLLVVAGLQTLPSRNSSPSAPTPIPPTIDPVRNQLRSIQRLFPNLTLADIQSIRLEEPATGSVLTLTRAEDDPSAWFALEYPQAVNAEAAELMAQTVAIMPYLHAFDNIQPAQYPEFGLSTSDVALFIFFIEQDETQHAIAIGDATPDLEGHYALVDDRRELYVVDAAPVAYLVQQFATAYNQARQAS